MTDELQQLRLTISTVKTGDGAAVIAVAGECDVYDAELLEAAIEDAGAAPGTSVYLDLRELGFLDSTALHVLVKAQRALESAGSELVLVAPTAPIRRTLAVSGLEAQFSVRERLDEPIEVASEVSPNGKPLASIESLFRSVNERILELSQDWGDAELHFFCECQDSGCTRPVSMSGETYAHLRAVPGSAVISTAHPDIERWDIIERGEGYVLVRDSGSAFHRNGHRQAADA